MAVAAMLAGILGSVAGNADAPTATVQPMSTMVEMLDTDDIANVATLAELRADVLDGYEAADGTGVDVALIDTGVAPVAGLTGDKVVHGPDLSFEGAIPEVAYLDTYGHGTHMAGIIAGDRPGAEGIAPGARIVSVKTAGHDGITTVPQVVAAIDWVVEHRNRDGLNIRVLNLSLGLTGVSSHVGDELSAAVERAWAAGIFVVVAAGNDGETQSHLNSPAISPYVLAVGASDSASHEDPERRSVPAWSAQGDGQRNPDLVAPGRSIASYRVPGSTVDVAAPSARHGDGFFLGSGTSQSAAAVSGLAAVMLERYPDLTPDQVKHNIEIRSLRINQVTDERAGEGHLNGTVAEKSPKTDALLQDWITASGVGTGLVAPTGATWTGGTWTGATWTGATWTGATWTGGTWTGATWTGATWTGATWTGATWTGATWTGATWTGATWTGATWTGGTWTGKGWA